MADSKASQLERIEHDPTFRQLIKERTGFAWILSIIMLGIYFGFILLVAFNKPLLATPIGTGVTTVGIPLGLGVIISAFVLTGIYVVRANSRFDDLTRQIVEKVKK